MEKDDLFSKVINNEKIVKFFFTLVGNKSHHFFPSFPHIRNVRLLSLDQSGGRGSVCHCGLNMQFLDH